MIPREDVQRWIVAKALQVSDSAMDTESVTSDTRLRLDLGITSLMAVSMVLDAEEHFGISVEDAELAALQTVGNVIGLVMAKLSRKPAAAE